MEGILKDDGPLEQCGKQLNVLGSINEFVKSGSRIASLLSSNSHTLTSCHSERLFFLSLAKDIQKLNSPSNRLPPLKG